MTVAQACVRELSSPLRRRDLGALEAECAVVQFNSLPSSRDLARIAGLMEVRPEVALRAYGGYDGSIRDLEFLEYFPWLRRFHADQLRYREFVSIDGLRFLPDSLEELSLGPFQRRLSLRPLARFEALRTLYLEGAWKDLGVVAELRALADVTFRSLTLSDLSLLVPLRGLRSLDIKLGGTRDLGLLSELAPIVYLELWGIHGLEDLSPVGELDRLQYLFLQDLPRVARLPDMRRMTSLRGVHLENMRGLTDLTPLCGAPALKELEVFQSRGLQPEHFECFAGHPTLRRSAIGIGSTKKNEAVRRLVDFPRPGPFEFR